MKENKIQINTHKSYGLIKPWDRIATFIKITAKDLPFQPLSSRNYQLYFIGLLISWTGTWMHRTALGWLAYKIYGSEFLLGIIGLTTSLPIVVFSPITGSIIEHIPKRGTLIFSNFCLMGLAFILAWLAYTKQIESWHMISIGFLEGAALAFDTPARQILLYEIINREHIPKAVALNSFIVNSGRVIGPLLAGIIMARYGASVCFLINGISFLAIVLAVLMMELASNVGVTKTESLFKSIKSGLIYAINNPPIRKALYLFAWLGSFGWSLSVLLPAYARELLNTQELGYGSLLSMNAIGAIGGSLTVATFTTQQRCYLLRSVGAAVFSLGVGLLVFTSNYHLALLILLIIGWGQMMFLSSTIAILQLEVDQPYRGRIMGLWTAVFSGIMPIGAFITSTIAEMLGLRVVLIISFIVATFVAYKSWKSNDAN